MHLVQLRLADYPGYFEKYQMDLALGKAPRLPMVFKEVLDSLSLERLLRRRTKLEVDTRAEAERTIWQVEQWLEAKLQEPRPVREIPTTAQRRAQRWQACVDAGLQMPVNNRQPLPRGISSVAKSLGITRQTLTGDLKAYQADLPVNNK